jgi:hypothetical protein
MFRAIPLYSKQKGAYKPIRLRVIRKTEEAKTKGVERLREKKRMKSHRKEPGEASPCRGTAGIAGYRPLKVECPAKEPDPFALEGRIARP